MFLDIFVIVLTLYAIWKGWNNGLLRELVSTLGFLGGFIIAILCYKTIGKYLAVNGSEVNMLTSIVAFLLLWVVSPIVLGTVATLFTKALNHLKFISLPNRLGGAAISLFKYILLMSLVLNMMSFLHILSEERKQDSMLLEPITSVTGLLAHGVSNAMSPTVVQNDTITQSDTVWIDVSH